MNGAVNFLKPPGMTSSDAVVWLRWVLGTKKVGHGGTLDPAAAGVLPVLVGGGTRLFDRMLAHEKTYAATVRFGITTDTLDSEGRVTETTCVLPSREALSSVLPDFIGEIEQIPPAYSAVRVAGKHAYALARSGKEAEIPSRKVHIRDISVTEWVDDTTVTLRVTCSAGTYIRTLAADLAAACGSLGMLTALTRESSGQFRIEGARTVEELLRLKEERRIEEAVTPMETLLCDLPRLTVPPGAIKKAVNGASLTREDLEAELPGGECLLYDSAGEMIGVFAPGNGAYLRPTLMLTGIK